MLTLSDLQHYLFCVSGTKNAYNRTNARNEYKQSQNDKVTENAIFTQNFAMIMIPEERRELVYFFALL